MALMLDASAAKSMIPSGIHCTWFVVDIGLQRTGEVQFYNDSSWLSIVDMAGMKLDSLRVLLQKMIGI